MSIQNGTRSPGFKLQEEKHRSSAGKTLAKMIKDDQTLEDTVMGKMAVSILDISEQN